MTVRRPIRLIKRSEMANNFTMSEAIDWMAFRIRKRPKKGFFKQSRIYDR